MEVIEKAIEKIREEMKKNSSEYIQIIGKYLIENIEVNKHSAELIINGNKTLDGCINYMEIAAKKVAHGGVAILTNEQGFKLVSEYYEFVGVQSNINDVPHTDKVIELNKHKVQRNEKFDFKAEDFL